MSCVIKQQSRKMNDDLKFKLGILICYEPFDYHSQPMCKGNI